MIQAMDQLADCAAMVRDEYLHRKALNPSYSLRAFARHLKCPPGRLSEILSGQRQITPRMARLIAEQLDWPPIKVQDFFGIIARRLVPDAPAGSALTDPNRRTTRLLAEDQFKLIADWYHFAVLSLLETSSYVSKASWIADRLRLPEPVIREALERLERLQLIRRHRRKWILCQDGVASTQDVPSAALRISHRQTLQRTLEVFESVPLDLREVTSLTMAIDVRKLPQAKQLIRKFRQELMGLLESGLRTEVYELNIQLMPLTRPVKSDLSSDGGGT